MINRTTIASILFVAALFAAPAVARAYNLDDLLHDTTYQLPSDSDQCSSVNIGNIVDRFNTRYLSQSIERAKLAYLKSFERYWDQWLMCIIGSIQTAFGGNTAKACTSDVASAVNEQAIAEIQQKFENDLITDCTAQTDVRDSINASRQVLLTSGRDGGAAFVRDWNAFQADNRYRGLQIARNEMANTNHCPWVSSQLQGLFNYDPSKAVTPVNGNEDGQNSYIQNAQCTLPQDFNPGAEKYQTATAFAALMQPQNNIWGSYMLAQEEVSRQIADEEQAAQNEFANTGGVGALRDINPQTGTSCAVMAPDGSTCLQYSKIVQPAAGVVADIQAQRQAAYDLVTNPRSNQQTADNVTRDLVSTFMSMEQPMSKLQYKSERIPGYNTPTPTPSPTNVPGSGDPGDPVCTGGNPDCHCAINSSTEQQLARGAVLSATQSAIAQHPEMIAPDGVSLLPGMNVPFLQAVCSQNALASAGTCRPNNAAFGVVLSVEPIEINVDIILPNNVIRQPGLVTLVCSSPGNM